MKLKELLTQIYEAHCERLPDESDEDYLTRCSNSVFNLPGNISQRSNLPNVMKNKIVIPIPIKEK